MIKGITAQRGAGQQFAGTEHAFAIPSTDAYKLVEVLLKMGVETKVWSVVKMDTSGNVFVLASSIGATTNTFVFLREEQLGAYVLPGERIGIITSGATAAMSARLYFAKS